jgi:hypothetical protein
MHIASVFAHRFLNGFQPLQWLVSAVVLILRKPFEVLA